MSDDMKLLLISSVFEREAIWDKRHADHHNRYKLGKQWKEVAGMCGTTTSDAKKKWKALRQQFKEKWEKLPTSGDPAPVDSIQWPYFQLLLFLRDNFEPRATSENLSSSAIVDDTEENCEMNSDYDDEDNPPTPISENSASQHALQPSTADSVCHRKWSRLVDPIGNALVEMEKKRKEMASQSLEKNDEDIAFFTSLLPHVRRMTPLNKMSFRIEVQKLVMERSYGVSYGSDTEVLP